MYIKRHLESQIAQTARMFGAVMVTGARQVGKTTLLRNAVPDITYITLDDPLLLQAAGTQAGTFFKDNVPPIFVDEIQYAPNLFPYVKMYIDATHQKGQFYLSGSQAFHMMKNLSESLAGRVGLLNLHGLSLREINGISFSKPFLPIDAYFCERKKESEAFDHKQIWHTIHQGTMPELVSNPDYSWDKFYSSYVKTYIERDVRELTQVGDEMKFLQFMTVVASLTGQLVNLSSISRDVGISQPTADRWLSILRASNIVYLLEPYYVNIPKRVVKTPKLYFIDTGLAAYLTRWTTPETLQAGAMSGAFFESFVIAEIIKSYANAGIEPPLYFYRDKNQNEIDLLIYQNGVLHPIEIKKHADPNIKDIRAFDVIDGIAGIRRGSGGVVCMYDRLLTLKGEDRVVPIGML
jgi:predicted AAA+ superfamily ATPase